MRTRHCLFFCFTTFGLPSLGCMPATFIEQAPDGGPPLDAGSPLNDGETSTPCTADSDCGSGRQCGFPEAPVCTAHGQCFAAPQVHCLAYAAGCACDGTEINLACNGLPAGYASKPLLAQGPCADAGFSIDSGPGSCITNGDCAAGQICGFARSSACSAVGQCFPPPGPICQSYSPGCACDGTEINIACNGLPSGYATKPVLHQGACATGGVCTTVADCRPNGGGACASVCADGTNPCANACVAGQCVERGCLDGGYVDAPAPQSDAAVCDLDGSLACSNSVLAYCADPNSACRTDWASAQADPVCFMPPGSILTPFIGSCDTYNVLVARGIDFARRYYYDKVTGSLVAVVTNGLLPPSCVAGPSCFQVPANCNIQPTFCSDAGD
jgi:hypothetical protein